jgi:hypothetical protein
LLATILGYLGYQYFSLVQGPVLEITEPIDGKRVQTETIDLIGKSEFDATVKINGEVVSLSEKGEFVGSINLKEGKNLIIVEAVNKIGKEKRIVLEIFRQ